MIEIVVLPGDGIGPEVTAQAVASLQLPEKFARYDMSRAREAVQAIADELGK